MGSKFASPIQPAVIPVSALPVAANWDGGIVFCPDFKAGYSALLQSDGTSWRPLSVRRDVDPAWIPDNFASHPERYWSLCTNCQNVGVLPVTVNGAGAAVTKDAATAYIELATGTATTGRAAWGLVEQGDFSAGKRWYFAAEVQVPTLSVAAQAFVDRIGLVDSLTAESAGGVYFRYTHSNSAGNFEAVRVSSGTLIASDSNIAVATTGFFLLEIEGSSAQVKFSINGSGVLTATTNIPPTSNFGPALLKIKSAGTTSRGLRCRMLKVVGER